MQAKILCKVYAKWLCKRLGKLWFKGKGHYLERTGLAAHVAGALHLPSGCRRGGNIDCARCLGALGYLLGWASIVLMNIELSKEGEGEGSKSKMYAYTQHVKQHWLLEASSIPMPKKLQYLEQSIHKPYSVETRSSDKSHQPKNWNPQAYHHTGKVGSATLFRNKLHSGTKITWMSHHNHNQIKFDRNRSLNQRNPRKHWNRELLCPLLQLHALPIGVCESSALACMKKSCLSLWCTASSGSTKSWSSPNWFSSNESRAMLPSSRSGSSSICSLRSAITRNISIAIAIRPGIRVCVIVAAIGASKTQHLAQILLARE